MIICEALTRREFVSCAEVNWNFLVKLELKNQGEVPFLKVDYLGENTHVNLKFSLPLYTFPR